MMNRFWKWLAARKFMQDVTPRMSVEEELAQAVLRFAYEHHETLSIGTFFGSVVGHHKDTGGIPPLHYTIERCDNPELCFGPTFAEGATTQ